MSECIQINERTWRIEDNGVRFFLLIGTEKAALIDTGMNCPDAKQIAQKLTELPLTLINTHADPDHISGNGAFEEFYMSPNEEENYRGNKGQGTLIPVREGDVIDLGERELKIIDIPGHTPGSIAILDIRNRVLISGDTVQDGKIFMFGKGRDMWQYTDSLKHLDEYAEMYDEIYPMHGSLPVGKDLIAKLLSGAEQIKAGQAQSRDVELFGRTVKLYDFGYAGFLCE